MGGDKIGSTIIAQSANVPCIAWNGSDLKVTINNNSNKDEEEEEEEEEDNEIKGLEDGVSNVNILSSAEEADCEEDEDKDDDKTVDNEDIIDDNTNQQGNLFTSLY